MFTLERSARRGRNGHLHRKPDGIAVREVLLRRADIATRRLCQQPVQRPVDATGETQKRCGDRRENICVCCASSVASAFFSPSNAAQSRLYRGLKALSRGLEQKGHQRVSFTPSRLRML